MKAWNLDTMEHIRTLEGHKDGVQCLGSVGNQLLLSGSEDKTVRVSSFFFCFETWKICIQLWTSDGTSAGCLNAINCVRAMVVVGDRIIVGIEIWMILKNLRNRSFLLLVFPSGKPGARQVVHCCGLVVRKIHWATSEVLCSSELIAVHFAPHKILSPSFCILQKNESKRCVHSWTRPCCRWCP